MITNVVCIFNSFYRTKKSFIIYDFLYIRFNKMTNHQYIYVLKFYKYSLSRFIDEWSSLCHTQRYLKNYILRHILLTTVQTCVKLLIIMHWQGRNGWVTALIEWPDKGLRTEDWGLRTEVLGLRAEDWGCCWPCCPCSSSPPPPPESTSPPTRP